MHSLKILIATHKKYEFPDSSYYVPIQVGKILSKSELAILTDDSGDNISNKNPSFCELTALYWAWKNHFFDDVEYVGLVHYRRYFFGRGLQLKGKTIASADELLEQLKSVDCLVPRKRNYYIETVYSHYKHAHHIKDLEKTREIIEKNYNDYLPAFDSIMHGRKLCLYNMFVMKREWFELYCDWLFAILFELEKSLDVSAYDTYQRRVFGFLSERLFNVWLLKNHLKIKEIRVISLEKQNFFLKGYRFLKRKLLG